MSLIFKSLKKLKAPPPEPEKIKKADAGNVYTFRKLLFSPQAAVLLFVLIIIAGFLAGQGYQFFFNHPAVRGTPSDESAAGRTGNSKTLKGGIPDNHREPSHEGSYPAPPETVPVSDPVPGKLALPSTAETEPSPAPEENRASSPEFGGYPKQSFTASFQPPPSQSNHKPKYEHPSVEPPDPALQSAKRHPSADERHRRSMLNEQFTMARLVGKIEQSIAVKDFGSAETLLGKLTAGKGEKNDYVLKLKAYLLIQKEDYPEAEDILKEILSQNRTDLNAGMNMAVIEARTNRLQSAYERLKQLSILYPESTEVHDLMARFR